MTRAVAAPSGSNDSAIAFSCADEVSKRIAKLYGDEKLADVVFIVQKSDDGPERRVVGHRIIVAAWSGPLDRMLCGDFVESSSREVRIRDVDPAAFEAMLKLMYCGTADITEDNVLAILDVSVRFDVSPLVQFCVQFLQNNTSSEHACRMLEVGVQYGLVKLVDRCIELIVTDDHIRESKDFERMCRTAIVELAKHDSWNMHEDDIYDTIIRWAKANSETQAQMNELLEPILEHLRYPYMSVKKLKSLTTSNEVPNQLIFDALFFKLHHSGPDDLSQLVGRYRPRTGSLLFTWVPTSKVTVSGNSRENARHTSSNGFTGVRGDRRMQHGVYSWTIDIAETQSSWIFVGVAQADDTHDVAWRSTGRMLYCLDSRYFHQGSGQNHPCGDRKIISGDSIRVVLDCTRQTLSFGINGEKPIILFRDLAPVAYVPAVDLRDCGDKVRILGCPRVQTSKPGDSSASMNFPIIERRASVPTGIAMGDMSSLGADQLAANDGFALSPCGSGVPFGIGISPSLVADLSAALSPPPQAAQVPQRRSTVSEGQFAGYSGASAGPPPPKAAGVEAHAATGGCGSTRMSQPRQSQGSQSGVPAVALAAAASATSLYEQRGGSLNSSAGMAAPSSGPLTNVADWSARHLSPEAEEPSRSVEATERIDSCVDEEISSEVGGFSS